MTAGAKPALLMAWAAEAAAVRGWDTGVTAQVLHAVHAMRGSFLCAACWLSFKRCRCCVHSVPREAMYVLCCTLWARGTCAAALLPTDELTQGMGGHHHGAAVQGQQGEAPPAELLGLVQHTTPQARPEPYMSKASCQVLLAREAHKSSTHGRRSGVGAGHPALLMS